ncbi:MAG: restriction endonuclease [Firmicutes bacterium]|nr:restriction endonuclease [Bacillota bacterium]
MAIPGYQDLMLPLLKLLGDKKEWSLRQSIDTLAKEFGLSEKEKKELLPSGQQPVFDNRVGWARTYMKKAGLVESTRRGYFRIAERGLEVLKQKPSVINDKFLKRYKEFVEFQAPKSKATKAATEVTTTPKTPKELIEEGYQNMRASLAQELLSQVKQSSPDFFERLVVELLVRMGYGGSIKDAGNAIGKSGDEGIDGIIKEDRLGLDIIYVQAKRWTNPVGRDEIQKFVGALEGKRAKKGVFLTTSTFTTHALKFTQQINAKVILIDGEQIAQYMIDFDVGVSRETLYEIKKIDLDFFEGE